MGRAAVNALKARSNESKTVEPVVPTVAERCVSNVPQSLGTESRSDERKKPPLLRFVALMRGGQTSGFIDVPNKMDRMKVSLLQRSSYLHLCVL